MKGVAVLEIKRLRLLWEFHARGTISSVALALNFSPSAVSQQLGILEREVGVQLLRRVGRSLELTPAGEVLVAETEALLAGLERAEAAMQRVRDEVIGTVRVATFQTAMLTIVPGALRRIRAEHPELRVEVMQYEPGAALQETWARGFDLVIAEQYPDHSTAHFTGLDRVDLTSDAIRLGIPAFGAAGGSYDGVGSISDLTNAPWVMEPQGAATRHWAEQACRQAGFEPDVRFETADLQAHQRLIEAGEAVALLPGLARVGADTRMRMVELPGSPTRTIFTAARKSRAQSPALIAVRAALAAEASSLVLE